MRLPFFAIRNLDVQTEEWGIKVTLVELRDISCPKSMKWAMARQAEAEREKRAKIIAAEGDALASKSSARSSIARLQQLELYRSRRSFRWLPTAANQPKPDPVAQSAPIGLRAVAARASAEL